VISAEEIQHLQDVAFRAVDFIEEFLPDIYHSGHKCRLTQAQKDAIDSIQFGFPLSQYKFSDAKRIPKGSVMIWPRQTGKTSACAYAACAFLLMFPNCTIGIISASDKAAKKLYRKIKAILRFSIFWKYVVQKSLRVDFLEIANGNYIEVWPCTDNIRGSTYTFLFADEAAQIEEEILFAAALPTTTHGERWIMLSTPYGPKGKFIDYYYRGLETRPIICNNCGSEYHQSAFNVDNFPNGRMPLDEMYPCVDCGALDYKYGIGRFSVPWVDPWNDGLRDPADVKDLLDDDGWTPWGRQEYLGEIVSDASMVILGQWLTNCTNQKLRNAFVSYEKEAYVLGVDYGRKHDASCFYVTHRDKKTGHVILDYALSVAGDNDLRRTYKYIRRKLMMVVEKFNPYLAVLDATGLGDPLVELFEDDIKTLQREKILVFKEDGKKYILRTDKDINTKIFDNKMNSRGFIISRANKPDLIGEVIKMFSKGLIEIPPASEPEIGEFREECLRFEAEVMPGTDYIKYGTQSFHDDRVIAFALSLWGHRQKPIIVHQVKPRGLSFDIYGVR